MSSCKGVLYRMLPASRTADGLDTPGDGRVGDAAADSGLMPANGRGVSRASLPLGRRPALQAQVSLTLLLPVSVVLTV